MRFDVLGPYEIPLDNRLITRDSIASLKKTWRDTKNQREKKFILEPCGCYVFSIKTKEYKPWYVGQANRMRLWREAIGPRQINTYSEILNKRYSKGKAVLFLLPMLTRGGKPKPPVKGNNKSPSIDFVED